MNFSKLNTIMIGMGLGLLLLSCFIATVLFGNYANSFNGYDKLVMKVSNDGKDTLYKVSIAITVLGLVTVIAAITTIVFSFIFDDNIILSIIIGGVTAFLALGCIISEGIYYGKIPYYLSYQNGGYRGKPNKDIQKYIKEAIEEIYNYALEIIKIQNPNDETVNDVMTWSQVSNNKEFKYNDIWVQTPEDDKDYLQLYINDGFINAKWKSGKVQKVGSIQFNDKTVDANRKAPKMKVCWINNLQNDNKNKQLKCKKINGGKYVSSFGEDEMIFLDELIETDYYKGTIEERDTFVVKHFPVCYSLMTKNELDACESTSTIIAHACEYKDSTNQYKISGSKLLEQIENRWKKSGVYIDNSYEYDREDEDFEYTFSRVDDEDKNKFFLTTNEPNTYNDLQYCHTTERPFPFTESFCYTYGSVSDLLDNFQTGDAKTRGRIDSSLMKQLISEMMPSLSDPILLYRIALIEMVVQIFGILFWACGRFLGFILNSDDREKSAGEGA